MESIITTFHLDWQLMLAQLVNFAIVAAVVWYFVVRPLTAVMHERTITVEKSLADAQKVAEQLAATHDQQAALIKEAKHEAAVLITQAKKAVEESRTATIARTKEEVAKIVAESKRHIAQEKELMIQEAQTAVADLVVAATGKVLEGVMTKPMDKAVAEQAIVAMSKKGY